VGFHSGPWCPLPFMGVRTMTEQPSAAATKPVEGELSESNSKR
jgi:hypothetical protein